GEFEEGAHILRAKIDMASPNINLRDPALYRIKHQNHPLTGDKWCIYPMYDFAHGLSDAYEGITHSLCTLEFEDHRPLYDWFLDVLKPEHRPRQIEFSRLNLAYTITSKRQLAALIEKGIVDGWDDPRMPTLAGMRRRGYPPEAIRDFCQRIGITKKENLIEMGSLENSVREALGDVAPRVMGVLDPLKVVLTNYPDDLEEQMTAKNHPNDPDMGERQLPFSKTLWIERSDFMEEAPRKFFRLKPEGEVRLRYAYIIKCEEVIKDDNGQVVELRCSYDPDTRSGSGQSERKVKGTIHWVSAKHAVQTPVRVYDRLFKKARPGAGGSEFLDDLNEESLVSFDGAQLEPSLGHAEIGTTYQFERMGYFTLDSNAQSPRFHRVVSLRDSWKKIEQQELAAEEQ
ncbi:MAG: glutamine--tRNA ligase, partial [Pseudomonadota bacterium]